VTPGELSNHICMPRLKMLWGSGALGKQFRRGHPILPLLPALNLCRILVETTANMTLILLESLKKLHLARFRFNVVEWGVSEPSLGRRSSRRLYPSWALNSLLAAADYIQHAFLIFLSVLLSMGSQSGAMHLAAAAFWLHFTQFGFRFFERA
jgi:hypothetical protein